MGRRPEWFKEDKVMPSAFAKSFAILAALAAALLGLPAFAQEESSGNDPFLGVQAVDSAQMSTVSGGLAGETANIPSTPAVTGDCGAGAQCSGGLTSTSVGTTTNDALISGNTVRINVTAINNQTTIVGPASINTGGGFNSAGAN